MEGKFYEQYAKLLEGKKQILIPTKEQYDKMVTDVQKGKGDGKNPQKSEKEAKKEGNIIRRYSIRIENSETRLYQQGESTKKDPQRVVKQEELFALLKSTHDKLGHAGRDLMWKELRNYYGISK